MDLSFLVRWIPRREVVKGDTVAVHLKHPDTGQHLFDEEGRPVVFVVYTAKSKAYADAVDELKKRYNARWRKIGALAMLNYHYEYAHKECCWFLAQLSVFMYNATYNGRIIDKNVFEELYLDGRFQWLFRQVDEAIGATNS